MSLACAPPVAAGLTVDVNGGQNARPAAESVLTLDLSPANRYNVRPLASVSVLPRDVCCRAMAEFAGTAGPFLALDPVVKTIAANTAAMVRTTRDNDSRLRFMTISLMSGSRASA